MGEEASLQRCRDPTYPIPPGSAGIERVETWNQRLTSPPNRARSRRARSNVRSVLDKDPAFDCSVSLKEVGFGTVLGRLFGDDRMSPPLEIVATEQDCRYCAARWCCVNILQTSRSSSLAAERGTWRGRHYTESGQASAVNGKLKKKKDKIPDR